MPTSRRMRTGEPEKRLEMMPSLIGRQNLGKGVYLDPPCSHMARVTVAGTAISARPATTPAFIMSAPAWKQPLRTS